MCGLGMVARVCVVVCCVRRAMCLYALFSFGCGCMCVIVCLFVSVCGCICIFVCGLVLVGLCLCVLFRCVFRFGFLCVCLICVC